MVLRLIVFACSLGLISSAASAACWCTCTSGFRDCHNVGANQCKRINDSLEYCRCTYAVGACPANEIDALLNTPSFIESFLSEQPTGGLSVVPFSEVDE